MGSNIRRTKYDVDLVFVIDATMSMDHILDMVKNNALNLYNDFQKKMAETNKHVDSLRVRIVAFRDYFYDREKAMMVTNFFELPTQAEDFEASVRSITADGGGDDPEDGLEALAYAIKSKWNNETGTGNKKRHVIVVWSDDGTHDLGYGNSAENYPKKMAKDFSELTEWWGSKDNPGFMDEYAKRLVMFTPDKDSWTKISTNWNKTIHYVSDAGNGLSDVAYDQVLDGIARTI